MSTPLKLAERGDRIRPANEDEILAALD